MLKFFSILTVILIFSLFFALFALINNSWNRIRLKNSSSYLEYGLWLLCSNDQQIFSSFIFNPRNCLPFNQKYEEKRIFSNFMDDNFILDLEPELMGFVQRFYLIGTCFLFLSTLTTISILIFLTIKFDDPKFYLDSIDKLTISTKRKHFSQTTLIYSHIKIFSRILLVYLFVEFILRLVAFLVFTFVSDHYLKLLIQKSYGPSNYSSIMQEKMEILTNQKSWSYWLCLASLVLSFICQVLVLMNEIINYMILEIDTRQNKLKNLTKSNIMFIDGRTNSQVTVRSNLLSIEPIEVSDDLLAKCDYNIDKIPKLDSKLFFIDNEYLRFYGKNSDQKFNANSQLSGKKIFDSVEKLEKSILIDSDSQLDRLENMLNELYLSSVNNTLRSEYRDLRIYSKLQNLSLKRKPSIVSLPNLNSDKSV